MHGRVAKAEGAAPVLHHEGETGEAESVREALEPLVVESKGVRADSVELVRPAEADVVGRDAAEARAEEGNHPAVEEAPGRLPVEKEHGLSPPLVEIVRAELVDVDIVGREGKVGESRESIVRRAVHVASQRPLPCGRRPAG